MRDALVDDKNPLLEMGACVVEYWREVKSGKNRMRSGLCLGFEAAGEE